MSKRGTGALPARATERPTPGHGRHDAAAPSRLRRAHRRRKPGSAPRPWQTMTEGGQPGGGGTAAASARPPSLSAQPAGHDSRPGRAGPEPCSHRTAAAPSPSCHPAGGRGATPPQGLGRVAAVGPHRGAPGAAHPSRTRSGPSRRRRCGRPRCVSGEKLSENAAGPGRGSPEGRAGLARQGTLSRRRRRGLRRPHLRVGPTQAVSVLSISWRIRSCSGRLSAILDGRDQAAVPLREAPGRDRGRRRPQSRAGGRGSRRGWFSCTEGRPVARAGVRRESKGRERRSRSRRAAPARFAPARRYPAALASGRAVPRELGENPRPLGITGRSSPVETRGSCPRLAPPGLPRSAPCDRKGTPEVRPFSRLCDGRTSCPRSTTLRRRLGRL